MKILKQAAKAVSATVAKVTAKIKQAVNEITLKAGSVILGKYGYVHLRTDIKLRDGKLVPHDKEESFAWNCRGAAETAAFKPNAKVTVVDPQSKESKAAGAKKGDVVRAMVFDGKKAGLQVNAYGVKNEANYAVAEKNGRKFTVELLLTGKKVHDSCIADIV